MLSLIDWPINTYLSKYVFFFYFKIIVYIKNRKTFFSIYQFRNIPKMVECEQQYSKDIGLGLTP